MRTAHVVLYHRFDPGSTVALARVGDERTLRAAGGEGIDTRRADANGSVTFDAGVEIGDRYIAVGVKDRHPLEVRARGEESDPAEPQVPVWPERPQRVRAPDDEPTAQAHAQSQQDVNGVPQRSDTPGGTATPID
jgi:hypothetical protein